MLAHEIGHTAAARPFGVQVEKIWLSFLGGSLRDRDATPRRRRESSSSPAPARSDVAVLAAAAWLRRARVVPTTRPAAWCSTASPGTNGLVALFNLLPGLPLDGGQVLRAGDLAAHRLPAGAPGRGLGRAGAAVRTGVLGLYWFSRPNSDQRFDATWLLFIAAMTWASSTAVLPHQALPDPAAADLGAG